MEYSKLFISHSTLGIMPPGPSAPLQMPLMLLKARREQLQPAAGESIPTLRFIQTAQNRPIKAPAAGTSCDCYMWLTEDAQPQSQQPQTQQPPHRLD